MRPSTRAVFQITNDMDTVGTSLQMVMNMLAVLRMGVDMAEAGINTHMEKSMINT